MDENTGLYKPNLTNFQDTISTNPINNPRGAFDMYYELAYSNKFNQFAFTVPYELYIMNPQTMKGEFIFRPKVDQIDNIRMYHNEKRILFINNDTIRSVNYSGKDFKNIKINIK